MQVHLWLHNNKNFLGLNVNKKVKNSTPLVYNGIKFRSKLEVFCYKKLEEENISSQYEQNKYNLMDKFTFNGEEYPDVKTKIIQPITYTPDFVIRDNIIIECKGFKTDIFPIKWKLFKKHLNSKGFSNIYLFLPKNQKQVLESIERIKQILNEY